jgi:hypothetical protein
MGFAGRKQVMGWSGHLAGRAYEQGKENSFSCCILGLKHCFAISLPVGMGKKMAFPMSYLRGRAQCFIAHRCRILIFALENRWLLIFV